MDRKFLFVENKTMSSQQPDGRATGFEVKEELVFFADLKEHRLLGTNLRSRRFLGKDLLSSEDLSYPDLVHPEDRERLREHLEACKQLEPDEFLYIQLRFRKASGEWEEFDLRHRSLRYNPEILLGLAFPSENNHPPTPSENSQQQNSRILVNSLDEAYSRIDLIFDLQERPIDFLYLETNPAFEQQLKFTGANGRTIKEFAPDYETEWLEVFGQVLHTKEPVRYERFASSVNQAWFNVYAFPLGTGDDSHVALLFSDITKSKEAEQKLKRDGISLSSSSSAPAIALCHNSRRLPCE